MSFVDSLKSKDKKRALKVYACRIRSSKSFKILYYYIISNEKCKKSKTAKGEMEQTSEINSIHCSFQKKGTINNPQTQLRKSVQLNTIWLNFYFRSISKHKSEDTVMGKHLPQW